MLDVIIIGAGPAGLIAARELASTARQVCVLEEHPVIGQPVHCTGLLGLAAFDELDLPRETILTTMGSARFHTRNGGSVLVDSSRICAALVDRASFDQALAAQASRRGADIRTGMKVTGLDVDARGVTVTTMQGQHFRARATILACGAKYTLNRRAGLGIPSAFLQSAQLELPTRGGDHIDVHFGRTIAPGGFAWLVPFQRDRLPALRLGVMADRNASLRFSWLAEHVGLEPRTLPKPHVRMIPVAPLAQTTADRVVAVGDAAGLVKPTTGGGIYYGLLSGKAAAETLDEALRRDDLTRSGLRAYEAEWKRRLGPDLRAGRAFRAIATRLDDRGLDDLLELARTDGIVPLLLRHGDFNWHRDAALALLKNANFRRIAVQALLR